MKPSSLESPPRRGSQSRAQLRELQRPPLTVDDLLGRKPAKLRVALQPYITLLELRYPLDDFVLAVKKRDSALRGEASNAVEANRENEGAARARLPRPKKVYLAVHRHN